MNSLLLREFSTDLSCSACITSGYVYYYGSNARGDIEDTDDLDGYCCREMTDGTLYCGDEMDKIFDHYISENSSDIDQERVDKVKSSYKSLVAGNDADAKTKAQELYLDLFNMSKNVEDGNNTASEML